MLLCSTRAQAPLQPPTCAVSLGRWRKQQWCGISSYLSFISFSSPTHESVQWQISNGNFDGNKVIQLWNLTFLVPWCIFLNVGIFQVPLLLLLRPFMKFLHFYFLGCCFLFCTSWADEIFFIVLPLEMIPKRPLDWAMDGRDWMMWPTIVHPSIPPPLGVDVWATNLRCDSIT